MLYISYEQRAEQNIILLTATVNIVTQVFSVYILLKKEFSFSAFNNHVEAKHLEINMKVECIFDFIE